MNFEEQLAADVREIEEILKRYLPKEEGYAKTVAEAVNYSVLAGGKAPAAHAAFRVLPPVRGKGRTGCALYGGH